jgi:8-oxo-dGTP pyrophosphatase MutT (NUDIX family)
MADDFDIAGLEYRTVAGIAVVRDSIEKSVDNTNNNYNLHDTMRKPTEKVYLLVKKPRADHAWQFPQGGLKIKKNETIPQAALRELAEECGGQLQVKLIDETSVFCTYQYPFPPEFIKLKKKKKQYAGAKVCQPKAMFSKAQHYDE